MHVLINIFVLGLLITVALSVFQLVASLAIGVVVGIGAIIVLAFNKLTALVKR
jgi:hypothetical protein